MASLRVRQPSQSVLLRSANARLKEAFRHALDLVNWELTVPVDAEEVFLVDPSLRGSAVERAIRDSLRFIVPPAVARRMRGGDRDSLRILASPWQCGRVLELDEKVDIDGVPYVLTVKGIGATTFARTYGGVDPWLFGIPPENRRGLLPHLKTSAFADGLGILEASQAKSELLGIRNVQRLGVDVDVETVLGVYRVSTLPDARGERRPTSSFQRSRLLRPGSRPVLLVRATKSNIRLQDILLLRQFGRWRAVASLIEHVKKEFCSYEGRRRASAEDYLFWLARKLIRQDMALLLLGQDLSAGSDFRVFGRNVSILGEEIDVTTFEGEGRKFGKAEYLFSVTRNFRALETLLLALADTINSCCEEKVEMGDLAHVVWTESRKVLADLGLMKRVSALLQDPAPLAKHDPARAVRTFFGHHAFVVDDPIALQTYQREILARIAAASTAAVQFRPRRSAARRARNVR